MDRVGPVLAALDCHVASLAMTEEGEREMGG